jgi:hypothetical protein
MISVAAERAPRSTTSQLLAFARRQPEIVNFDHVMQETLPLIRRRWENRLRSNALPQAVYGNIHRRYIRVPIGGFESGGQRPRVASSRWRWQTLPATTRQTVRRVTGAPGELGGLVTNGTHDIGCSVGTRAAVC